MSIVILTSILGAMLLLIGNCNRKNKKIYDINNKNFETQYVSNNKLSK